MQFGERPRLLLVGRGARGRRDRAPVEGPARLRQLQQRRAPHVRRHVVGVDALDGQASGELLDEDAFAAARVEHPRARLRAPTK